MEGLDFDRQKIIGNYIVDFFCKDLGFVVEIDGSSHDDKVVYDKERDEFINSFNIDIIHYKDEDIKNNLNGVVQHLKEYISQRKQKIGTPRHSDTPLKKGITYSTPLKRREGLKYDSGNTNAQGKYSPLIEGRGVLKNLLSHPNFPSQLSEWKQLGFIAENFIANDVVIEDLEGERLNPKYQFLPVDTKFFKDLEPEILSLFDNLDESLNGWLIKSENYQALNTLLPKFKEKVQTIYIDPPYNTGKDEFMYKDKFQDSSWLTLLENRLQLGKSLLSDEGVIFISIDDREHSFLNNVLVNLFGKSNFINNIIWQKKFSPQNDAKWFSDNHDFIICYAKNKEKWKPTLLFRTAKQNERYENPDDDARGPWMSSGLDVKTYSKEYDYPITTPSGRVVYPPKGRCWRCSKSRFEELVKDNRIWFGKNGYNVPRIKRFLSEVKEGTTPLTIWLHQEVGHNQESIQELKNLGFVHSSPKPVRLLKKIFHIGSQKNSIILDFFAGSGTAVQSVMNLNSQDKGNRKFIIVDMSENFDEIIVPRAKKIAFSFNWRDGKPKEISGIGIFFKYYELEQYEGTLAGCKYEDSDLFSVPNRSPYQEYVFLKDEKLLDAMEIDYKNKKVNVDLSKLYDNIDIAETLSNLTGKWIKQVKPALPSGRSQKEKVKSVLFEDGSEIDLENLDYKLIKPLIWWE